MKIFRTAAFISLMLTSSALAEPAKLSVIPEGIDVDGRIEQDYGFCVPAEKGHVANGPDKSVGLSWAGAPETTKSYAIVMVDPDVPVSFDDAGKEGKTIPADAPRRDFYHWVLVNIPVHITSLDSGADSNAPNANGKSERKMPYGLRGINSYAEYMASNPAKAGVYAGYDGPCPPWNDERIHHYHFTIFALDVEKLDVPISFGGDEALKAIGSHILAQGEVVGTYTLNPTINSLKQ